MTSKERGFSFVEMLVVMSMMAVTLVAGGNYFVKFSNRRQVEQVASMVKSQIELARSHAKVRRLPVGQVQDLRFVRVLSSGGDITIVSDIGNTYSSTSLGKSGVTIGNLANGELCFSAGDVKLVDLTGTPLSIGSTVAISIFQTDDPTMSKLIVINSTGVVRAYSYDALATSTPQPTITPVPTLTPGPTSTSTPVPTPAGGIVHCNNGMDTWDCDPGCDCGLYFDECSNCPVVPTATPTEEGCIALGDPCSSSYDCCYGYCGYAGFQYECMLYSSPTPTATRTPTPTATRTPTPTPSIISCFDGYQDWECGGGCQCGQQYPDCDFCPYATPTLPASCSPLGDPCWYDYDCCSNFCDFNGFGYECAP